MRKFIFDVDDTLYNMMDPFGAAFRRLYGDEHADVDLQRLFVLSRKYSDEVFLDTVNGTMTMEAMYIYRIRHACADLGISMTDEEALCFQGYYAENQKHITMPETTRRLLAFLKERGCTLGIITNGPAEHQRNKTKALGVETWIPADHIFISGALGAAKPDRRIFDIVVSRLGGTAEEYTYIGDSFENDVSGAKGAGWNSIWINRRGAQAPETPVPDHVVCSESELYELLYSQLL